MSFHTAVSAALIGLVAATATSATASAQSALATAAGGSDGITVYGTGDLSTRPNWVEIDLNLSGKAELTADALVKYRDAKKRVIEALEKLNVKNLSMDERGLTVSAGTPLEQQQRAMNGMPQVPTKTQIEVASVLRVRVKDVRDLPPEDLIKTVGRLLDAAQDTGVSIGPSAAEVMRNMRYGNYTNNTSAVRFVVADLAAIREKAYEQAVADARSRAARLAKLNQLKLGAAMSVQEVQVAGDQQAPVSSNVQYGVNPPSPPAEDAGEPRLTSNNLSGINVQVKLLVRFAIQSPDPATAQK
jgi:uncharacterized protein YggE